MGDLRGPKGKIDHLFGCQGPSTQATTSLQEPINQSTNDDYQRNHSNDNWQHPPPFSASARQDPVGSSGRPQDQEQGHCSR